MQSHLKKEVPDIQDAVSISMGKHSLKAGIYYEKGIINGLAITNAYPQGQYTFNLLRCIARIVTSRCTSVK